MSRCLWAVEVEIDFPSKLVKGKPFEFSIPLPPRAQLLELRFDPACHYYPRLWFLGDVKEPNVTRRFLCVQTGEEVPQGYSFVGLIPFREIMSFGLFVAG